MFSNLAFILPADPESEIKEHNITHQLVMACCTSGVHFNSSHLISCVSISVQNSKQQDHVALPLSIATLLHFFFRSPCDDKELLLLSCNQS
jgi:hypothetical protein